MKLHQVLPGGEARPGQADSIDPETTEVSGNTKADA